MPLPRPGRGLPVLSSLASGEGEETAAAACRRRSTRPPPCLPPTFLPAFLLPRPVDHAVLAKQMVEMIRRGSRACEAGCATCHGSPAGAADCTGLLPFMLKFDGNGPVIVVNNAVLAAEPPGSLVKLDEVGQGWATGTLGAELLAGCRGECAQLPPTALPRSATACTSSQ